MVLSKIFVSTPVALFLDVPSGIVGRGREGELLEITPAKKRQVNLSDHRVYSRGFH